MLDDFRATGDNGQQLTTALMEMPMNSAYLFRFCEPCGHGTATEDIVRTATSTTDKEQPDEQSVLLLAGTRTITEVRKENGDPDISAQTHTALPC